MELNTDGDLNTGGSSESVENNGAIMNTVDFRALQDGADLPSEITFTTGGGEIADGGLAATDVSVNGGSYFEVDSAADGKFLLRGFSASGSAVSTGFMGIRFRISDPDNFHILMWQSKTSGIARIGKVVDGSSTYTAINQVTEGTGAEPILLVVALGDNIKGFIGDEDTVTDPYDETDEGFTQVANITDSFNQTETKAGARIGSSYYRVAEISYPLEDNGGGTEEPETPPTATYDGDKSGIVAGSNVTMDFSGSTAVSPATIDSYTLTQVSTGTQVSVTQSGSTASYTAPTENFAQDLVFQLIVTDTDGVDSAPVVITHSVAAYVPTAPTVSASFSGSLTEGDTFTPTVTASNYDSVSWACTSGQNPTFDTETELTPDITVNESGDHTFRITATSVDGKTAFSEFTVSVAAAISKLNLTILGVGTSGQYMKLWDYENEKLIFKGQVDFVNDVAEIDLNVAAGTVITGDQLGDNPPITGTGTYGVTV